MSDMDEDEFISMIERFGNNSVVDLVNYCRIS